MMKRTLTLIALLTFFSTFLAAQARFEIVTEVEGIVAVGDSVFLTIPVTPTGTLDVRVDGLNLSGIIVGGNALLEGIFTLDGPRATDVVPAAAGELSPTALTGRIVDIDKQEIEMGRIQITLLGGWVIVVPVDAALKDEFGNSLELSDFDKGFEKDDFVKAEGKILAGWFVASELKITPEFVCPTGSQHLKTATKFLEYQYKETVERCVQREGGLTGPTQIGITNYEVSSESTLTVGKYVQDERHGLWITMFNTSLVYAECFYHQGELVDGDEACPE